MVWWLGCSVLPGQDGDMNMPRMACALPRKSLCWYLHDSHRVGSAIATGLWEPWPRDHMHFYFFSHCLHFCFLNLSILFWLISWFSPLVIRESRKSYSRDAAVEFIIVLRMADFYWVFWCHHQRLCPAWTTHLYQFCEFLRTQVFSQAHSRF